MHKNYLALLKRTPARALEMKQNRVQKLTHTAMIVTVIFANLYLEKKNQNSAFLNFVGF